MPTMPTAKLTDQQSALRSNLAYSIAFGLWLFLAGYFLSIVAPIVNQSAGVRLGLDFALAVVTSAALWFLLRHLSKTHQQALHALADQQTLLATLLDILPDAVFIKDRNSRYIRGNKALFNQMGIAAPTDMVGKTDFDFFPAEAAAHDYANDRLVFNLGQPLIDHQSFTQDRLGRTIWVQTTKVPLRDGLGNIVGVLGIVHDLTEVRRADEALHRSYNELEQRVLTRTRELSDANAVLQQEITFRKQIEAALRKSEELYRTLARNFPNGAVMLFDRDLRYTLVEGKGLANVGLSRDMLEGKRLQEVFPAESTRLEAAYFAVFDGVETTYEVAYSPDHIALVYIIPVKNEQDEIFAGMVMSLDITERKRMEQALRTAHDELEKRVEERTTALSSANMQLQTEIAERERLEGMEREQRILAEALRDTAAALNSTLNLDELLERILENLNRVVHHDMSNIMLIEDGVARIVRQRGYERLGPAILQAATALRFPINETPEAQLMIATGRPVIIDDVRVYPHWRGTWTTNYMGAPIHIGQEVIGFLALDSVEPGVFTERDADRLQAFANQAAIAIQNARLYKQAQTLAALQERQHLARELHDAVSQTLFSASVIAESLPQLFARDSDKVARGLGQLQRLTRSALAEMRTLLLELRPADLSETDLSELFRQLIEAALGRTKAVLSLSAESVGQLAADVQLALYRITQESLNNALHHSQATEIAIRLSSYPDRVEICISDNGRGFDPDLPHPGHLGLGIMAERASAIGASLTVKSQPGQGTAITLTWRRAS